MTAALRSAPALASLPESGFPLLGRVVTPGDRCRNRSAAAGNAAWGGRGRSSLADRRAGPRGCPEFCLGAGPRRRVGAWWAGRSWVGLGLDYRWLGLDLGGWRLRLAASRVLLPAAAIASGLVPAALFAVGGGPVVLTGMPAPPALGGALAGRATVACLRPLGQEPTFTAFEQATSAAGVPPARASQGAGWLTLRQCEGKLSMAHGRVFSRAVRRRGGGTSRRHIAPTT